MTPRERKLAYVGCVLLAGLAGLVIWAVNFRLRTGRHLPLEQGLPPLVLLVACILAFGFLDRRISSTPKEEKRVERSWKRWSLSALESMPLYLVFWGAASWYFRFSIDASTVVIAIGVFLFCELFSKSSPLRNRLSVRARGS